jgi:hypothetical protein
MTETEALRTAVMYYSAGIFPKFEAMGHDAAKKAAEFCSEWSGEQPLWLGGATPREVPGFGTCSAAYGLAVMSAFIVWVQKLAGHELPTSPLLQACESGWDLWKMGGKKQVPGGANKQ